MAFEKIDCIKSIWEECLFQTIDRSETETMLVFWIVTHDSQWIAAEVDDKLSVLSYQHVLKELMVIDISMIIYVSLFFCQLSLVSTLNDHVKNYNWVGNERRGASSGELWTFVFLHSPEI